MFAIIEGIVKLTGKGTSDADPLSVRTTNDGAPVDGSAMPAGGSGKLGWLSAIWTHLGTVIARLVNLVDDTRASYGRLRPDQEYIERYGATVVSGTVDMLINNSSPVPAGYDPQNLELTVPAGKIFLLKGLRGCLDAPGNSINVMLSMEVGTNKKVRMSLNTNSPSQGATFDPAIPIPAGTVIRVWGHSSGQGVITFIRYTGIMENA